MSNWCYNKIDILGSNNDIKRFARIVKGNDVPFTFSSLCPMPDGIDDPDIWFNWRLECWGTPFDPRIIGIYFGEGLMRVECYTSLKPPFPFIDRASICFPDLRFEILYHNPVKFYAGSASFEDGINMYYSERDRNRIRSVIKEFEYAEGVHDESI
jgi:hypothetical protein